MPATNLLFYLLLTKPWSVEPAHGIARWHCNYMVHWLVFCCCRCCWCQHEQQVQFARQKASKKEGRGWYIFHHPPVESHPHNGIAAQCWWPTAYSGQAALHIGCFYRHNSDCDASHHGFSHVTAESTAELALTVVPTAAGCEEADTRMTGASMATLGGQCWQCCISLFHDEQGEKRASLTWPFARALRAREEVVGGRTETGGWGVEEVSASPLLLGACLDVDRSWRWREVSAIDISMVVSLVWMVWFGRGRVECGCGWGSSCLFGAAWCVLHTW